uniref:Uncharacterized protein n=1 Tax=Aegilops tauschii subsp. strangulata TaxID=200361 RepID=A0A453KKX3_AEGTS
MLDFKKLLFVSCRAHQLVQARKAQQGVEGPLLIKRTSPRHDQKMSSKTSVKAVKTRQLMMRANDVHQLHKPHPRDRQNTSSR